MKITTIDEFLQRRVVPEHLPIVARLRALMKECAPKAKEQNKLRHTDVEADARNGGGEPSEKRRYVRVFARREI